MKNRIPFMKIAPSNLNYLKTLLKESVKQEHYTNFGPNEKKLTQKIEKLTDLNTICVANATLALDGLHHILAEDCKLAYLPGFTFPATNLGCRVEYNYGVTNIDDNVGFVVVDNVQNRSNNKTYSITTAPFGSLPSSSYKRPPTDYWIVDNAAGADPEMRSAKFWAKLGADVIIYSLHATKIFSGCEGGLVVFNNEELYREYKKYISFGFYFINQQKNIGTIGSNHKMSELSAAHALMYYEKHFNKQYEKRINLANHYKDFCVKNQIQYIYSPQAFWIRCKTEADFIYNELLKREVETRPYYRPLLHIDEVDNNAKILSKQGLCLPTWDLTKSQTRTVLDHLQEVLEKEGSR